MPTQAITSSPLPQNTVKAFNPNVPSPLSIPSPVATQSTVSPIQPQQSPVSQGTAQPQTMEDGSQVDPSIVALMHGLKTSEGANGDYTKLGDIDANGDYTAGGIAQWSNQVNGQVQPLQQGQIPANFAGDAKQFGLDPTDFSPENQNKVLYAVLAQDKAQGLTPEQALSKWNSGDPNKYADPATSSGTGQVGAYNVAAYVQKGMAAAQQYAQQQSTQTPQTPATGATTTPQSPSVGGFLQNVAGSAGNFLSNLGQAVTHPISTVENLGSMGIGALQEAGGETNSNTAAFDQLKSYFGNRYGSPQAIASTIYSDPVGFAADLSAVLGIGGGAVGLAGKAADIAGLGSAGIAAGGADFVAGAEGAGAEATQATAASGLAGGLKSTAGALETGAKMANPLTLPIAGVGKALGLAAGPAASAIGSVSGLGGDAVKALWNGDTTVAQAADISRASVGDELQAAFDGINKNLSDTGSGYTPIKQITTPITVAPDFLENQLRSVGKLDVVDGTIKSTTVSDVGTEQVGKLQSILNDFKPAFQKGSLTPEEYLALRGRLADASFNEAGFKNGDLAKIAGGIRENLNTEYRPQVQGLEDLDNSFSTQKDTVKELQDGLFYKTGDKKGQLMPSALSKIANATKAGNDTRLAQLEKILPGITDRIQAANIAEKITSAIEKGGGGIINSLLRTADIPTAVGGLATGNFTVVGGALATALLSNPSLVAKVLEVFGSNKALMASVVQHLGKVATLGAVTSATNNPSQPQTQDTSGQAAPLQQPNNTQTPPSLQTPQPATIPLNPSDLTSLATSKGFDLAAAEKAGYSDQEIQQYLEQN